MASTKGRTPALPRGAAAYRFDGDDEMVLFVWNAAPSASEELSTAEREVLRLVLDGHSNADIAVARGTSARTVANQVAALLRKLGAASRFELIARGTK